MQHHKEIVFRVQLLEAGGACKLAPKNHFFYIKQLYVSMGGVK